MNTQSGYLAVSCLYTCHQSSQPFEVNLQLSVLSSLHIPSADSPQVSVQPCNLSLNEHHNPTCRSVFYCCHQHHDQKQLRKERVYFILPLAGHNRLLKEIRAGSQTGRWRQGLKKRPWRKAVSWLVPHGFAFLYSSGPPVHSDPGPPMSVNNQEMPYRLCYRQSDGGRHFLK